jgi:TonB-linked SusC/RagA family outer membrane protein
MNNKLKILFFTIVLISQSIIAQNSVSGRITDSNGDVLPGVTIQIKGTNTGQISNFDGEYTITISGNDAILVFSYLGMKTKEIVYTGQTVLNVILEEEANRLNEIVVIGYGAVKKRDVTGTISSVKDSIIRESKTPNLFDAIQGRIAGVNIVSNSGELGAGVNFNIRGSNSVFGSGSPLFVIDGVQIDVESNEVANAGVGSTANLDPLATINPLDIESIEVLKDASATAIYGSRGANGVIIITTKGGKKGELTFNYTGSVGFQEAANTIDVISPEEYLIYRELRDPGNSFTNVNGAPRDFSNIPSRNWQDEALRTAVVHNHFISASGGTEKTRYSASAGLLEQEGLIIENDYSKYNFRINATHDQSDRLKFGFNINTSFTETNGVANSGSGGDEFNGVVQFLVIANPWELLDLTQEEEAAQEFLSPLSLIEEGEKILRFSRTIGSFYSEYKLSNHLRVRSQIGANFTGSKMQEFHSSDSRFGWRWNGRAVIRQTETSSYNFTNTIRYTRTFNKKHWFNVLGGVEFYRYSRESFFNDIIGFDNQEIGFNDISIGQTFKDYGSNRLISKRMSYFSRINYTLKGKYLFTFNFRADGSDRFGANNRWGFFPGAAFAWRAHRERFFRDIEEINQLKFRVSYGQTGNERIPPFTYLARVDNTFYSSNDALNFGASPGSLGNPDLQWETTTQFNIGFDLGLFNDRLNFTFDYYNKLTTDMLLNVPIAAQSGFNQQFQNIGSVENEGFEFSFSSVNINKPNFRWTTDFNISTNVNTIKDLGNVQFIPTLVPSGWITNPGRVIVGQPIGTMYGYVFDGIHQEGNAEGAVPGTMKYKDLNGDGVIDDENDRTIIGDSNPKHIGGINNSFTFKNFNFSFFWQWSYGNEVFNAARLRTNGFQPFMNITREYYENAWTPENQSNSAPAFGQIEPVASSYFVEDASFLRLKTVNFSYDFPRKMFQGTQISGLRLFISANNLLTFTKYTGFDPEVSSNNPLIRGFERFSYPRARTVIMGLNLNF